MSGAGEREDAFLAAMARVASDCNKRESPPSVQECSQVGGEQSALQSVLDSLWMTFEQDVARELARVRSEYGVRLDEQERAHYRELVRTRRIEEAKTLVGRGINIGELGWRNIARTCPRDWWYIVKIANAYGVGPTRPLGEYEK